MPGMRNMFFFKACSLAVGTSHPPTQYCSWLSNWSDPQVDHLLSSSSEVKDERSNKYTRWFKYDRDWLCVNKSQFVPVIFQPPCTSAYAYIVCKASNLRFTYSSVFRKMEILTLTKHYFTFLRAFTKSRKATISFVMPVRPSVRPPARSHGSIRLALDGFCWNLIFQTFFENLSRKFKFH
jgi:hypothetical protein